MKTISYRKLNWKFVSTGAAIAVLVLSPVSCKKKPTVASSTADANAKISALSSGPAKPAGRHIAGSNGVTLNGGGDSFAHVTYAPAVKQFAEADVRSALQGISSDGHSWLFKNAPQGIKNLQANDIFMVPGAMAAKVLGVVNQDDQTLVVVTQASLKDLVAGGQMKVHAPIHFNGSGQQAQMDAKPFLHSIVDMIEPPVYAQSVETIIPNAARDAGNTDAIVQSIQGIAGATVSGWTVTNYSFTPGQSQCNFQIVLVKDVGGFVARVAAKGTISDFDFATNLDWTKTMATGGKYIGPSIFNSVKDIKGTIQFDWEIGKQSPGVWATEDRVALPGGISISLAPLLEGMPLTLDVSSALLIHPALTGGNEFSRGGFSITWGGGGSGGGFSTTAQGAVADGGGNINLTYNITTDENISPVAPNAMVISYCAPRIELRLDVMGPFAPLADTIGGKIDTAINFLSKYLPANVKAAIAASPLSKMTASNILTSNADVFVQFIATEGVTHSSNITPAPCTKTQIKFDADGGISAQFFGLTEGAQKSANFYTKEFTEWNPGSNFCKSV